MNTDITRIFFGFALPPEVSRRAGMLRTLVTDPKNAVRWVKGRNIHLTMRFLGETPRTAAEEIIEGIKETLTGYGPLAITIKGAGVFPAPTRPRVLWMGVTGDSEGLIRLEQAIHDVVRPLGFPREDREFHAHVTLGRVHYPQKVTPDVSMFLNSEYDPIRCELKSLHLYESNQGADGLRYIPLATFPITTEPRQE